MLPCVVVSQESLRNSSSEDLLGKDCTNPTPYTMRNEETLGNSDSAFRNNGSWREANRPRNVSDLRSSYRRKIYERASRWPGKEPENFS